MNYPNFSILLRNSSNTSHVYDICQLLCVANYVARPPTLPCHGRSQCSPPPFPSAIPAGYLLLTSGFPAEEQILQKKIENSQTRNAIAVCLLRGLKLRSWNADRAVLSRGYNIDNIDRWWWAGEMYRTLWRLSFGKGPRQALRQTHLVWNVAWWWFSVRFGRSPGNIALQQISVIVSGENLKLC